MLNMGFSGRHGNYFKSAAGRSVRPIMFSATMPPEIQKIAESFQKDPQVIRVVKKELTVPKVTQYYYEVKPRTKVEVMCRLLDLYAPKLSVAFCNTKKQVDELVDRASGTGLFCRRTPWRSEADPERPGYEQLPERTHGDSGGYGCGSPWN